ncbi:MAG: TRAP transporter small permease subunit [Desulfobacteraceae bacterium]|jgi:TRAP-type C4-dicarboxylate transport system permease small subunit
MKALNAINRIADIYEAVIRVSLIISMGAIAFIVNLAVFFRYVLSSPLSWTTEISSYLLVYTVLFGACVALRRKQFVKIEVLINMIPFPVNKTVIIISQLLIIGFLIVCIISPSALIQKAIITQTVSPALGIPMVYLYRLLRFGFLTMLFFLLLNTIGQVVTFRLK